MGDQNEAVRRLGDSYARTMPDEYPESFAYYMAEQDILEGTQRG